MCALRCVFRVGGSRRSIYPVEGHEERNAQYPHYSTVLKLESVEFLMSLNRITKFEHLNEISINVYII